MKLNLNNSVLSALSKCFDVILATLYFILCSLPVVTVGAAVTAVSATLLRIRRNECSGVTGTFFGAFRQNFKQATLLWLPALLVGGVLVLEIWGIWFGTMETSLMLEICKGITIFFAVLYCCILAYLFSGLGTFCVTLKQALQNALVFAVGNIPETLALIALAAVAVASVFLLTVLALPVIAVCLYLQAAILGKVFAPYLPKNDPIPVEEELVY